MHLLLVTLLLFSCYSLSFSLTLMFLSKSQTYGLFLLSILISFIYTLFYLSKRHFLFNTLQKYFTASFITTILISIFYSIATISILVYYDYYDIESPKLKHLIIETENMEYCIWLNLSYYAGCTLFSWNFMIQYYRVFWVNFIVELFGILRENAREEVESVLGCVKRIEMGEEVRGNMCALCLEVFGEEKDRQKDKGKGGETGRQTEKDEMEISQLPCKHYFHEQCIHLWVIRTKSCPLCRRVVFVGFRKRSSAVESDYL